MNLSVRMSEDLHRRLVEAAAGSMRSLNSEILWRLQRSFDHDAREEDT